MATTTTETSKAPADHQIDNFESQLQGLLSRCRNIDYKALTLGSSDSIASVPDVLSLYIEALRQTGKVAEAEALTQVREKVIDSPNFGGLGLSNGSTTEATPEQVSESLFLVEAWLDSVTSAERAKGFLSYLPSAAPGTKPMTLSEKIFAQHVIGDKPAQGLVAGDVVRVGVDWILASELSWAVSIISSPVHPLTQAPTESHRKNMCTPTDTHWMASRQWTEHTRKWDLLGSGETIASGWPATTSITLLSRVTPRSRSCSKWPRTRRRNSK